MGSRMFCDADVYKSIGDTLAWVCMNIFIEMQILGPFSFCLLLRVLITFKAAPC